MSEQKDSATATAAAAPLPSAHMNSTRVVLKTILEASDGGLGLVGRRIVIGGWVKSSRELRKEPVVAEPPQEDDVASKAGSRDVSCSEILQSRIPFIRSIIKILGGSSYSVHEKLEPAAPRPTPPSIAFLQVSDGSCASSLLVMLSMCLLICLINI